MLHVKVKKNGVDRKLSVMNINSALYYMTSQMHMDMNLYVPKRQGNLRDKSFVNKNRITYAAPYARAQFRGFVNGSRVRNYTTPGTSRRWDLRAKANHMDAWRKAFIKGGNL
ncbi:capsid protein [Enterococcus faecium]|nr:minor capsid protein [Enterococcus faecium]PQG65881.1 capsid protein [Enterococcus faecium]